jgi:hypothetical protein
MFATTRRVMAMIACVIREEFEQKDRTQKNLIGRKWADL